MLCDVVFLSFFYFGGKSLKKKVREFFLETFFMGLARHLFLAVKDKKIPFCGKRKKVDAKQIFQLGLDAGKATKQNTTCVNALVALGSNSAFMGISRHPSYRREPSQKSKARRAQNNGRKGA